MAIHLPHPAEAKRQRSRGRELLFNLDDRTIDELLHRAKHPSTDGWPPSGAGGGSNDISRPVETAVIADAGGRLLDDGTATEDTWTAPDDTVRDAIVKLFAELAELKTLAERIDQRRQWILNIHDSARGRRNTTELCASCDKQILHPQKVKRLDGQPYHHPDPIDGEPQPQCWWDEYRAARRAAAG